MKKNRRAYVILLINVFNFAIAIMAALTSVFKSLEYLVLGKARQALTDRDHLIHHELASEALKREDGTAIARLGPPVPGLYSNLAVVVPRNTQQIKDILAAVEEQKGGRSVLDPLAQMVGHDTMANLTLAEGAKEQRVLLSPFTSDVSGFLRLAREMFANAMREWSCNPEGFVLLDEIKFLIRCMSARRIVGSELTREEHRIIDQSLVDVRTRMNSLSFLPTTLLAFNKAKSTYRLFSESLLDRLSNQIINGLTVRNSNFLSELIQKMTDYKNTQQDPKNYIHHPLVSSAVLVIATLDGIYTNLTSILLQLLTKPDIVTKLREECQLVSEDGQTISDDQLKDKNALPYLHRVYMEALRFNSSLPLLARHTKDGIQTDQTTIPPNSNLLINLRAMHYDKQYWGDDAAEFNPDRFLRPGIAETTIGQAPFIPFSIGARQCPGMRVGEVLLKLFISEFILNYTMAAVPGQPAPRVDDTALAPDPGPGYLVTVTRREGHELQKMHFSPAIASTLT